MALVGIGIVVLAIAAVVGIAVVASGDRGGDRARHDPASVAPAPTAPPTVPPGLPVGTAPPAPSGVTYADPQGTYTLTIDPAWAALGTAAGGVEAWAVGTTAGPEATITPNVTIVTQVAHDTELASYLATSVADLAAEGATLVEERLVRVGDDRRLGVMRYRTAATTTLPSLEFLAVFDVADGTAVVATLTAPAALYADLAGSVEPYLTTLRTTR